MKEIGACVFLLAAIAHVVCGCIVHAARIGRRFPAPWESAQPCSSSINCGLQAEHREGAVRLRRVARVIDSVLNDQEHRRESVDRLSAPAVSKPEINRLVLAKAVSSRGTRGPYGHGCRTFGSCFGLFTPACPEVAAPIVRRGHHAAAPIRKLSSAPVWFSRTVPAAAGSRRRRRNSRS
jgi:hypothetical protein